MGASRETDPHRATSTHFPNLRTTPADKMEMQKEEFVVWVRQAMAEKKSIAYQEMYHFLTQCFVRADKQMTGRVSKYNFDSLVEEAAVLPRKYGFAPKSSDMFPNEEARKKAREAQFDAIDTHKQGYISLEDWIKWATNHIMGKVKNLPKDYLGEGSTVSKSEFVEFVKRATDKSSPEYRELYFFLLKTFQSGDVMRTGEVDPVSFDKMIEAAAAAPRRHGLAPKSEAMFASDTERLTKRKEYFVTMDTNKGGTISFDEWLQYAYEHIVEKVASLG